MPVKFLNAPSDGKGNPHNFGGGANEIIAQNHGDGIGYVINGGGGDDIITGANFANLSLTEFSDDTLFGGSGSDTIIGGLGNDTIYGGEDAAGTDSDKGKNPNFDSTLTGDVEAATGLVATFTGGNDHLFGSDGATNNIYGDTQLIGFSFSSDNVTFNGGNDELVGGDSNGTTATNNMRGDANSVSFSSGASGDAFVGGDDTMTGGSGAGTTNNMWGDTALASGAGSYTGGADTLTGGANATNNMYGDSNRAVGITSATGGDDALHGGSGAGTVNNMYGDFNVVTDSTVVGGADTLYAGAGATDNMYGDWDPSASLGLGLKTGGADTFVIGVGGGTDTIFDFRVADQSIRPDINGDLTIIHETVVLDGFEFTMFSDLAGMWSVNGGGDTVLDLDATNDGAGDTVTFVGIDDFNQLADSFDFA